MKTKRNPKPTRARTEQRRRARRAEKRARKARNSGARGHAIASYVPGQVPHLHDDCPYCKALAAVGARPDAQGVVTLSAAQEREYQRQLAYFIETDGLPEGAVHYSGEQLQREFMQVAAEWAERGVFDDVQSLSDAELDAITMQILQAVRERAIARTGVGGGRSTPN